MTQVIDVMADDGFEASAARDESGSGTAWRKTISMDAERGVGVMIWKADGGSYVTHQPGYAETFVVLTGTADCAIGDGEFVPIGPGSIVHMPLAAGMRIKVKTPYRMVATAIAGSLQTA